MRQAQWLALTTFGCKWVDMAATPIRTCIGCRGKFSKKDLLRFVRDAAGDLRADSTGKLPGRGAYVCRSQVCINAAFRPHQINARLRVNLLRQVIDSFRQELLDLVNQRNVEEV